MLMSGHCAMYLLQQRIGFLQDWLQRTNLLDIAKMDIGHIKQIREMCI